MTDQNTRPQPSEPMLSEAETRRLVERLEARIKATEKLERAIATRPQPSAEPVAYLYEDKSGYREAVATRVIDGAWRTNGWTETPLYPASALEAARREALEQAALAVQNCVCPNADPIQQDALKQFQAAAAQHLRNLKENTNG